LDFGNSWLDVGYPQEKIKKVYKKVCIFTKNILYYTVLTQRRHSAALPPGASCDRVFYFVAKKIMAKVSFFIDGFNLYHALNNDCFRRFKWLNLRKLAELYLRKQDTLADIFYFTAFARWNPDKVKRHEIYIQAQEFFGVRPIYGEFRRVTKTCRECGRKYDTFEEKETDVNIAIKLFEQAYLNTYDRAVILSGDSDLIPVMRAIRQNFPAKKVDVLIPPGGKAKLLIEEADFNFKIKSKQLSSARLPDEITFANGRQIRCPEQWR